jgi:hypothetical protein
MVTKLRQVPYAEVIGYWLRYEYKSRPEFREYVDSHFPEEQRAKIKKKNFRNESDNAKRYEMLHGFRFFVDWFLHARWWRVELDEKDIAKLIVIHDEHWYKLSGGSLKAIDIAKSINSQKSEFQGDARIFDEKRKVVNNIDQRVKERSRLVVVAPENGHAVTIIDGVHRAIRLCLYYFVRRRKNPRRLSQPAYLGLTPDPIQRSEEQWKDVTDFFH